MSEPHHQTPSPVSASALASVEKQRRDLVRSLGPCRSGCEDLDEYVLLGGGFERGSVVGISAEEEDAVGVTLGFQVLACSLLDETVQKVRVVTPKLTSTIVVMLTNGITAELKARGVTARDEIEARLRGCLDRIMLSRIFDMDGLWEVLAEVEAEAAAASGAPRDETRAPTASAEIRDSQDEDEERGEAGRDGPRPAAGGEARADAPEMNASGNLDTTAEGPAIILVTHFSSLLTGFFIQRDNSAAHDLLRLLASHLRRLSRTLPCSPLILLINSTDSGASAYPSGPRPSPERLATASAHGGRGKPYVSPTLRSIFNPAPSSVHAGASPLAHNYKTNKPKFGLVFTQLLDLHLLCTRAPRPSRATSPRATTVVEVLLDDVGVWEGERGFRRRREQRWTIVASHDSGRIIGVYDGEGRRENRRPRES
ncbi:hypothetical protein Trco_007561 [Trichoderma cornu-damae]|uniref:Uncharacterized protein n=1 Tax=Trichoderma cornu-damae TaxID=654480 RepID=A0A9P8QEH5_9HYPO|nr:hypothetical protein Trco_007561 [Trichoderma cornu-damae]